MARCGCGGTCNCTVQGLGAFVVTGTGDVNDPYVGSINTNPDSPLPISSSSSGLSVAGIQTTSTNCITLSGNGSAASPLRAVPRLSPTGLLSCGVNGLQVDLPSSVSYPNAGRLINVSPTYQISVQYPLVASASTTLSAASVDPNGSTTPQTISSGSATITNPSSTETMLVQVTYMTHGIRFQMAGVGGTPNSWNVVSSTFSSAYIFSAGSTTAGFEYAAMGSYSFRSGIIVSVAPSASYTASFAQQFVVGTTSGSVSNSVTFTPGAINLVGWLK